MAKAFLSHSSHDKDFVEKIYRQLGKNNCHLDTFTFEAGNRTLDEILGALEDTDVFIIFISDKALESPWVKKELSEAHKRLSSDKISKIFPLIIDNTINYDDPRIPTWVRKPYNIHKITNQVVVLQKIKQFLREVSMRDLGQMAEMEDLFVGRNDEMALFERDLVRIDNSKPTCIIVTGLFDGIGRRTFLRNGLTKTRIVRRYDGQFFISIGNKESIENFILALNQLDPQDDIYKRDLASDSLESKIEITKDLLSTFLRNGIIVNVLDEGSIVLPNNLITDWFTKVIGDKRFENQVTVCLISKFRPRDTMLEKMKNVVHINVPPLSKDDTQNLFIQYSGIMRMQVPAEATRFLLDHLSGIPAQVIYCVNHIKKFGLDLTKRNIKDIDDFAELRVLNVLENFKTDEFCIQLMILLARFDMFSFDLLNKIVPDQDKLYGAIDKLLMFSILDLMGSTREFIRLNPSVADYVRRSRLQLDEDLSNSLNRVIKDVLSKEMDLTSGSDYAEFLIGIQEMISSGQSVPKRYFIASFMLKMLIQKYNDQQYGDAIELANQVLENDQRYDPQVVREVRYWLCQAYAKDHNDKFYEVVRFFENEYKDYNFLLGFNMRNQGDFYEAEKYYKNVLAKDPQHSKTKNQLVIVYLAQNRYQDALETARDNYLRYRTNPYHIHAYFTCLVKKGSHNAEEGDVLQALLNAINRSLDVKAKDFERVMVAEHKFYVKKDIKGGISSMQEAVKLCRNKYYPKRALYEMYEQQGLLEIAKTVSSDSDYNDTNQLG